MNEQVVMRGVDRVFAGGAWVCALDVPAGMTLVTSGAVAPGDLRAVPAMGVRARRARGKAEGCVSLRGDWMPVEPDQVGDDARDFRAVVRRARPNTVTMAVAETCVECGSELAVEFGRCGWCAEAVAGAMA